MKNTTQNSKSPANKMKEIIIIGHVGSGIATSDKMLHFAQQNDVRLLTVDQSKEEGIIGQNVFTPEPIHFKIQDLILTKSSNQNKYSGEKVLSKRGERRKNARNAKMRGF